MNSCWVAAGKVPGNDGETDGRAVELGSDAGNEDSAGVGRPVAADGAVTAGPGLLCG